MDRAESAGGRLGAVLAAPRTGVVPLGPGAWLTTTPALAKQVLTDHARFDFPDNVSRSGDLSASRGDTRSGHVTFAPLTPEQLTQGLDTFAAEWAAVLEEHDRATPTEPYDGIVLLRRPVSRATCAAVMPGAAIDQRDLVADRVLAWIDSLAPVISAARPPRRWSRARRTERAARHAADEALADIPGLDVSPQQCAVMLAAGVQVPIAAGAWLLSWAASHPLDDSDPVHVAWETLRLTPPTWITARLATEDVQLDGHPVPAGSVVLVSPLLLGRLETLVPGEDPDRDEFRPDRWRDADQRPGAWLPFGAGPHACPGRSLGMSLLVHLATWAASRELVLSEAVGIDQSRGLAPTACRFTVAAGRESTS
jgi:cytochrome P450